MPIPTENAKRSGIINQLFATTLCPYPISNYRHSSAMFLPILLSRLWGTVRQVGGILTYLPTRALHLCLLQADELIGRALLNRELMEVQPDNPPFPPVLVTESHLTSLDGSSNDFYFWCSAVSRTLSASANLRPEQAPFQLPKIF
ncbi:hypothetical protein RU639_005712 [Aspergillus parasiticus]